MVRFALLTTHLFSARVCSLHIRIGFDLFTIHYLIGMRSSEAMPDREYPVAEDGSFFRQVEELARDDGKRNLVTVPSVVESEEDSAALFRIAYRGWQSDVRVNHLVETLDALQHEMDEAQQEQIAFDLYRMRRATIIWRSAWANLDEHHVVPVWLKGLQKQLGVIRDALRHGAVENCASAVAYLQTLTRESPWNETETFVPADKQSFAMHEQRAIDTLASLCHVDELSVHEMHRIRRQGARPLMVNYLLLTFKTGDERAHDAYLFVRAIVRALGQMRDDALRDHLGPDDLQSVLPELQTMVQTYLDVRDHSQSAAVSNQ